MIIYYEDMKASYDDLKLFKVLLINIDLSTLYNL